LNLFLKLAHKARGHWYVWHGLCSRSFQMIIGENDNFSQIPKQSFQRPPNASLTQPH
jgi:hypothetical protein